MGLVCLFLPLSNHTDSITWGHPSLPFCSSSLLLLLPCPNSYIVFMSKCSVWVWMNKKIIIGCIQKIPSLLAAELFAPNQNTIPNESLQCIDSCLWVSAFCLWHFTTPKRYAVNMGTECEVGAPNFNHFLIKFIQKKNRKCALPQRKGHVLLWYRHML